MNRNEWIAVSVGLVFVAFLIFGGGVMDMFGGQNSEINQVNQNQDMTTLPESGVETVDTVVGSGETAEKGDKITVHYVGTLPTGRTFDSSLDRNEPFSFTLGAGDVIRGWDEGLVGMKVGGERRVMIAPDYAYGSQAIGSIPANSTLIFEVKLLDVEKEGE